MPVELLNYLGRLARGRPRLLTGAACGLLVLLGQQALQGYLKPLLAWDVGVMVYLVLASRQFFTVSEPRRMASNAAAQREGMWAIFALEVGATAASVAVIVNEFTALKDLQGAAKVLHLALVAVTLLVSWLMTHATFTFRYAHMYYELLSDNSTYRRGLVFPGEEHPDYLDFFYFAVVVGMTFQVSDVQIADRHIRRLVTVHGLLSFLFSTIILALTVNLVAGLV